ncbi:adenine-specific methyltransferase EcoRI family protein [Lentilactobacillus kribbianus]|uniref:adenine-specific methyltransferase EcoRI family protein n=1 Tax=Lentilactobacillus kribbianus TaxID=2729622 RepID=UPI0015538420|nr:adenine-specific methyltransferase EcoRI family protein [Lentilactobacillus kribbianus]
MQRQKAKSDEWYTPASAVKVIEPYVKDFKKIWCPFDTSKSEFVKVLSKNHEVVYSHISEGGDFFSTYKDCDAIVSNPPFSKKNEIYKRLFELGKPFAMIGNMAGLFDAKKRLKLFQEHEYEILVMYPRVKFINPDNLELNSPTYQSNYICHNILPEKIILKDMTEV